MAQLPSDFFLNLQAFSAKSYRDSYPAIDPELPEHSLVGKVVILTGGSDGLGKSAFGPAIARAKASALVLVARSQSALLEAKAEAEKANPSIKVSTISADVTDEKAVSDAFEQISKEFGPPDVLINNAGTFFGKSPIADMSFEDFETDIDVNVNGTFLATRAFLKLIGTKQATILNVSSAAGLWPGPCMSSYSLSKLVVARMAELVALERPNVTAIAFHPGMLMTRLATDDFAPFALDKPTLPGGFAVWLLSPKAKFLNGRYVHANWDVEEMMQREKEIVDKNLLRVKLSGDFGKK
ncbi:hypothetical protein G647_01489 [Cladophialophora carrionii CBS 160.54]|uniref:Ketoreductase domain-containing protein n=1 Tax=Cladophialophora carrionii CBS 160.54 TaxID=1279043 RepID=V9DQV6_9EURO|nr:uncharacterized protein G647_01489 [Cladophialophora carrionii CBS 160.54]ETI29036.1 hypothetical protein G647_01489 [Cladophialophora carrionii CBS 160.54]